ncbi:hypothetical protein V6N12_066956 [Hibiscus sabdariffa]|uniref:Reverse transcriptase zinc-binding domain-containing protein n=1 Tax=Hibiscus sabdariffa TaxID=183260 RepID=A0ABR2AU15_9ROSI
MEPRISGRPADLVGRKLGFDNSFQVEAQGFSGGILIIPLAAHQKLVWAHLSRLNPGNRVPWILGGDFNAICKQEKRVGILSHPGFYRSPGMVRRLNNVLSNASVADMIDDIGCWRWPLFERLLPLEVLLRIGAVKPPLGISNDRPGWRSTSNTQFSVRSAFEARKGIPYGPLERIWRVVAEFTGLPRVQTFLWLVCHGKLPTNDERSR